MDAFKISIKLFAERDSVGHAEIVPVLHRWIQEHVLADHLVIDVADYAHVPAGPGTVLVTHEANLYLDREKNQLGVLYSRKTPLPGSFPERLRTILGATLNAASLLEQEPALAGKLKFRTNEIEIKFNDRLLAPNTPETFAAVKADLQSLADDVYGPGGATIESTGNPQQVLTVKILGKNSPPLADLFAKFTLALA